MSGHRRAARRHTPPAALFFSWARLSPESSRARDLPSPNVACRIQGPASPEEIMTAEPSSPDVKAPVPGLYGEADQGIPVAQVEAIKGALAAANKPAEFKLYPG